MSTITPDHYIDAAYHIALDLHQPSETRRSRPHIDNFKKKAAMVLGVSRLYKARWEKVIEYGEAAGLFKVDRTTLSYPIFVLSKEGLERYENSPWNPPDVEPGAYVCDNGMLGEYTSDDNFKTVSDEEFAKTALEAYATMAAENEDTSDEPTVEVDASECRPRLPAVPGEGHINDENMAVLVQYPPGHADYHKGLHAYLDCFFSQDEVDDLVHLAKRRGAILIHVVRAV